MSKRGRGVWEMDTARVLMLLAQQHHQHHQQQQQQQQAPLAMRGRVFECKTCSRQFPTFQALGGHRASHKRTRLLQQQRQQHALGNDAAALCPGRQITLPRQQMPVPAKPRAHECPVCGLEFAVGQALGGHMRRHRAEADAPTTSCKAASAVAAPETKTACCDADGGICLDLNLTPSENCAKCRSVAAGLGARQGVPKALAMLDCTLFEHFDRRTAKLFY